VPGQTVAAPTRKVAGADGRVADLEGEDGLLDSNAGLALDGLLHHRKSRRSRADTALNNQAYSMSPSVLALVTSKIGEFEAGSVTDELRGEGKQAS